MKNRDRYFIGACAGMPFGLVGMGDSMKNVALYMQGEILNAIKAIDEANASS